ncbi:hypothetical protein D0T53_07255 [Dysgonomonas sp. 216]|uniref:porin n=1 Tax=Dysgonomonas sp. 216 TaxID=2302934 RepID=UPI0013D27829|nr:porin [Dysgonomonas sp. 216]NDW18342.1 hypothetical protein [Dysgonomonas sp. 216]NDW18710.1 hypothetical protein [Dysgonomonas sp. 216]
MKKIFTVVLLFAFYSTVSVFSQEETNNKLLEKLVEKNILTKSEAEEILSESEQESSTTKLEQTVEKVRNAFNTPYMQFGGYGLFWYRYNQYENVHHDMNARVVFISVRGQLNKYFRYFILADFVNPQLYEFYGEWTPSTAFNLRAGQFKIPFSLENPFSLTDLETISNTRSVSYLVGMAGDPIQWSKMDGSAVNHTGRDVGVMASGSLLNIGTHDLIQYGAGVFQGTGMGVRENNSTKDFAGNIIVQPIKDLRIAGNLYAGKTSYRTSHRVLDVYPFKYPYTYQIDEEHGRNRWGLSGDYRNGGFYARSEWIKANDGGIKKEGLYGLAQYYVIPQKLSLLAKVDYLNIDKKNNNEVFDYVAGMDYYFWKKCRLQLNYIYSDYSKNWSQRSCENTVQLQMQIAF